MRGRRGLGYVDWIVSLGTFLVVVLAIFVFLQPGAKKVQEKEMLVDRVMSRFEAQGAWDVLRVPLFVRRLDAMYTTNAGTFPAKIDVPFSGSFGLGNSIASQNVVLTPSSSSIEIRCALSQCVDEEIVFFFYPQVQGVQLLDARLQCTPSNGPECVAVLGASEHRRGLNPQYLSGLSAQGYATVKQGLQLPANREFSLQVGGVSVVNSPHEPVQGDVVVRNDDLWFVAQTGEKVSKRVSVKVW